ncbi:hypothetical protein PsYK624_158500 [Phanerochaete sordida]|uniref:Uncharacterized protein n=1 Tax=Phanerochaete sordida TaxID=48140 RepID=A0A9P3LLD7_9APHY|nr:hypothetical protein PsYK624_158500 [Phanerochaete sordida]
MSSARRIHARRFRVTGSSDRSRLAGIPSEHVRAQLNISRLRVPLSSALWHQSRHDVVSRRPCRLSSGPRLSLSSHRRSTRTHTGRAAESACWVVARCSNLPRRVTIHAPDSVLSPSVARVLSWFETGHSAENLAFALMYRRARENTLKARPTTNPLPMFKLPTHLEELIPPPNLQVPQRQPWRGSLFLPAASPSPRGPQQELRCTAAETGGDNSQVENWPPAFSVQLLAPRPMLPQFLEWLKSHTPPMCMFMADRLPDPAAQRTNQTNFETLVAALVQSQSVAVLPWNVPDRLPGAGIVLFPTARMYFHERGRSAQPPAIPHTTPPRPTSQPRSVIPRRPVANRTTQLKPPSPSPDAEAMIALRRAARAHDTRGSRC